MELAKYVQSTKNRKLQYIKKVSQLLLCFVVLQNIQLFYGGPVSLLLLVSLHSQTVENICLMQYSH